MSTLRRMALVALAAWLGNACERPEGPAIESAVVRFFRAAAAQDCERAKRASTGALRTLLEQQGCEAVFSDMAEHEVVYRGTGTATPDGRAADARIVRVQVSLRGKPRERLLRVERSTEGGWKLASR